MNRFQEYQSSYQKELDRLNKIFTSDAPELPSPITKS